MGGAIWGGAIGCIGGAIGGGIIGTIPIKKQLYLMCLYYYNIPDTDSM